MLSVKMLNVVMLSVGYQHHYKEHNDFRKPDDTISIRLKGNDVNVFLLVSML
jgi:hypothetical protein